MGGETLEGVMSCSTDSGVDLFTARTEAVNKTGVSRASLSHGGGDRTAWRGAGVLGS